MTDLLDTLDPIFADCLGDEDYRYTLTKPWVHNGFVYATDGRIAVRQPTELPDTIGYAKPSPPNSGALFGDSKLTGKSVTLPDIGPELGDGVVCEKCKGKDSTKTCSECKGEGIHVCPTCAHEKPCRACDGEGKRRCCKCDEGTIQRERQSIKLAPKHTVGLADYYVWLLQRHGVKTVHKALKGTAFCFRKGDIEGLVMGKTLGDDDNG